MTKAVTCLTSVQSVEQQIQIHQQPRILGRRRKEGGRRLGALPRGGGTRVGS